MKRGSAAERGTAAGFGTAAGRGTAAGHRAVAEHGTAAGHATGAGAGSGAGAGAGYGPATMGCAPGLWDLKKNTFEKVPGLTDADEMLPCSRIESQLWLSASGGMPIAFPIASITRGPPGWQIHVEMSSVDSPWSARKRSTSSRRRRSAILGTSERARALMH